MGRQLLYCLRDLEELLKAARALDANWFATLTLTTLVTMLINFTNDFARGNLPKSCRQDAIELTHSHVQFSCTLRPSAVRVSVVVMRQGSTVHNKLLAQLH